VLRGGGLRRGVRVVQEGGGLAVLELGAPPPALVNSELRGAIFKYPMKTPPALCHVDRSSTACSYIWRKPLPDHTCGLHGDIKPVLGLWRGEMSMSG